MEKYRDIDIYRDEAQTLTVMYVYYRTAGEAVPNDDAAAAGANVVYS